MHWYDAGVGRGGGFLDGARTQTVGEQFAKLAAASENLRPEGSRKTFGPYAVVSSAEEPIPKQFGAGDCAEYAMAMVEAYIRHVRAGCSIDEIPTFAHCIHNIWRHWRLRPAQWVCGSLSAIEIAQQLSEGQHWPPAVSACVSAEACFIDGRKWYGC